MEAATRPSVQPQGVAGFVPEGRVLLVHLWDPWPGDVFPAERSEVTTCSGVLAGPQESLVFLIPGNSIDMYSDNGTSGSLSQPVSGRSPCQGLSASANEIFRLSLMSLLRGWNMDCLPHFSPGPLQRPRGSVSV